MTIQRLYVFTLAFGVIGFVLYWALVGFLPAIAFFLGTLGSLGSLWLFNWLAHSISPGEQTRKPWQAGTFVGSLSHPVHIRLCYSQSFECQPFTGGIWVVRQHRCCTFIIGDGTRSKPFQNPTYALNARTLDH